MSARELATVLLRVAAVYLLIQVMAALPAGLWAIGYIVESLRHERTVIGDGVNWQGWSWLAFTVWPPFLYAATAVGLLVGAPRLAGHVVSGEAPSGPVVVGGHLQATAITVLGVGVLAGAAPRVASTAVILAMTRRVGEPLPVAIGDAVRWPALLELGVTVAVGLYLCLGARGLAGAIQALRRAGTRAKRRDA